MRRTLILVLNPIQLSAHTVQLAVLFSKSQVRVSKFSIQPVEVQPLFFPRSASIISIKEKQSYPSHGLSSMCPYIIGIRRCTVQFVLPNGMVTVKIVIFEAVPVDNKHLLH